MRTNHLGQDHPDVAESFVNMGLLYQHEVDWFLMFQFITISLKTCSQIQGKCIEALDLFNRAIRIRQKSLQPNHPDLAVALNAKGDLLGLQVH